MQGALTRVSLLAARLFVLFVAICDIQDYRTAVGSSPFVNDGDSPLCRGSTIVVASGCDAEMSNSGRRL